MGYMGERQRLIIDTNQWIDLSVGDLKQLVDDYDVYIPMIIVEELDHLKCNQNGQTAYNVRKAIRFIYDNYHKFKFVEYNDSVIKNDNKIIHTAKNYNCAICSEDLNMKIKCISLNIPIVETKNEVSGYKGYREIFDSKHNNDLLASIYENKSKNILNLYINEYLLIKDKNGNTIDKMKYTNDGLINFNNKNIDSKTMGSVKPLDEYQSCLIDSLINNQMTMVKGKAGSGKSLISLAYAFNMIDKGKYNNLIVFCNPINSRNSARLGFYPGTRTEKLLDSFVGGMLASKLGGMDGVYHLIENGKLLLLPFSDIRGFDSSGMRSVVYIVEAQNLSVDLMKTAIQRVGKDCKLIIDGDDNSQVDMSAYEGNNSGMKRVSEVFRGHDFYGEVELQNIYRSKMAQVADLM